MTTKAAKDLPWGALITRAVLTATVTALAIVALFKLMDAEVKPAVVAAIVAAVTASQTTTVLSKRSKA